MFASSFKTSAGMSPGPTGFPTFYLFIFSLVNLVVYVERGRFMQGGYQVGLQLLDGSVALQSPSV